MAGRIFTTKALLATKFPAEGAEEKFSDSFLAEALRTQRTLRKEGRNIHHDGEEGEGIRVYITP